MSLRPRPVTATVTKPRWMEMPDAKALAHARRHSLGSTGSTASLVSVLDHDSYISVPSDSEIEAPRIQLVRKRSPKKTRSSTRENEDEENNKNNSARLNRKTTLDNHVEGDLLPWETWLIRKTQQERERRRIESQRKKQEKAKKYEQELEKNSKELKAQHDRIEWMEKKRHEEMLRKRMEKLKLRNEKTDKERTKRQVEEKSNVKFKQWLQEKHEEERAKRRAEKEKKRKEEEEKRMKAEKAEQKFQEWVRAAMKRPKSAPSSYGYMDGKLKGYHDTAAYPKPSFYNPIPWQPIHVPRVKNEKPKRSKAKKYVWNPKKYY